MGNTALDVATFRREPVLPKTFVVVRAWSSGRGRQGNRTPSFCRPNHRMDPLVGKSQALEYAFHGTAEIATVFPKRRVVIRPGREPLFSCQPLICLPPIVAEERI